MSQDDQKRNAIEQARVWMFYGSIASNSNRWKEARQQYELALIVWREVAVTNSQHDPGLAETLYSIGLTYYYSQDLDDSYVYLSESAEVWDKCHSLTNEQRCFQAQTLRRLGDVSHYLGNDFNSRDQYIKCVDICRDLSVQDEKFTPIYADNISVLGMLNCHSGEYQLAKDNFGQAVRLFEQLSSNDVRYIPKLAAVLFENGRLLNRLLEQSAAKEHLGRSVNLYQEVIANNSKYIPECAAASLEYGRLLNRFLEHQTAKEHFGRAANLYQEMIANNSKYIPECALASLEYGRLLNSLSEPQTATEYLSRSINLYQALNGDSKYTLNLALANLDLGISLTHLTEYRTAKEPLGRAVVLFKHLAINNNEYLRDVATARQILGTVHNMLNEYEMAKEQSHQAVKLFQELAVKDSAHIPELAAPMYNLGIAYDNLEDHKNAKDNLMQSVELLQSCGLHSSGRSPRITSVWEAWGYFGRYCLRDLPECQLPDVPQAICWLQKAILTGLAELRQTIWGDRRRYQLLRLKPLFEEFVQACMEMLPVVDQTALLSMIQLADSLRCVSLQQHVGRNDIAHERVPGTLFQQLHQLLAAISNIELEIQHVYNRRFFQLRESESDNKNHAEETSHLRESLPAYSSPLPDLENLEQQLINLQSEYRQVLRHIKTQYDPQFEMEGICPLLSRQEMLDLVPTDKPTVLAYYILTRSRAVAVLINQEGLRSVPLPKFSSLESYSLESRWELARNELEESLENSEMTASALALREQQAKEILAELYQFALRPVLEVLSVEPNPPQRLLLCPHKSMHIVPLNACVVESGDYLGDQYEVSYVSSLFVQQRCNQQSPTCHRRGLVIQDPTGNLPLAPLEAGLVSRALESGQVLPDRTHPPSQVKQYLLEKPINRVDVFHYSGHADFDPEDPVDSVLEFDPYAQSRCLRLREVLCGVRFPDLQLAFLNGCKIAQLEIDATDDYLSFPLAFQVAGARAVIGTLWVVNDRAALLLSDRFYRNWLGGQSIATALQQAQKWLRTSTGHQIADYLEMRVQEVREKHLVEPLKVEIERYRNETADDRPYQSMAYWAAYTVSGITFPLPAPRKSTV